MWECPWYQMVELLGFRVACFGKIKVLRLQVRGFCHACIANLRAF